MSPRCPRLKKSMKHYDNLMSHVFSSQLTYIYYLNDHNKDKLVGQNEKKK